MPKVSSPRNNHDSRSPGFSDRLTELLEALSRLLPSVKLCAERVEVINALTNIRDAVRSGQVPADEVRPLLRRMQAALHDSEEGDAGAALSPVWTAIAAEARGLLGARRETTELPLPEDRYAVAYQIGQYIEELFAPFVPTERDLRDLLRKVWNLLNALPLKPAKLRFVREEIQRLPLFQAACSPLRLSMRQAEIDLPVLQERLQQILELATVAPVRRDGRQAQKGQPRPFQKDQTVAELKSWFARSASTWPSREFGRICTARICQRLANHPRPPNAKWKAFPWPEALRRFPKAVRTWLSKAIHERD